MTAVRVPLLLRWFGVLLLSGGLLSLSSPRADARTVTLGLIADRPQSELESQWLPEYLRAIGNDVDLVMHAGGLRHPDEACHDALYVNRHERFQQSPAPLLYTPAALDWALCDAVRAHPFQKTERLGFLRQLFFSEEQTLGITTLPVTRQGQSKRYRLYVENQRLRVQDVVVLSLNLPENDNNYSFAAGRNGEFEERDQANRQWLEAGFRFAQAQRARWLVILASADMEIERLITDSRSPYHPLLSTLDQQLARHRINVLWVSRGVGPVETRLDRPLSVPHFWRVRSHGSLDPGLWTRIELDGKTPRVTTPYIELQ